MATNESSDERPACPPKMTAIASHAEHGTRDHALLQEIASLNSQRRSFTARNQLIAFNFDSLFRKVWKDSSQAGYMI